MGKTEIRANGGIFLKLLAFCSRPEELGLYRELADRYGVEADFSPEVLGMKNAELARGYDAVEIRVSTRIDREMAERLRGLGVRYVLSRTAGTDHIDPAALTQTGLKAACVPEYSPAAIAEHSVLLSLMLLRRARRQILNVKSLDFRLDGLCGRELGGMTVGIYGTGRIGAAAARIFRGFGSRVLAFSGHRREELEETVSYVPRQELFGRCDLLSFHCPLTEQTARLVNRDSLNTMKDGVVLVNTARGGLFDFEAVLGGLKSGKISALGLDVFENEQEFMRKNLNGAGLKNPVLRELLDMDQVIFTPHTAFYTQKAIRMLIETTMRNLDEFARTGACANEVRAKT